MTPQEFEAIAPDERRRHLADLTAKLFGPGIQDKALAALLGFSERNAIRWRLGEVATPPLVLAYLHQRVHGVNLGHQGRADALDAAADALDRAAQALRAAGQSVRQLDRG